MASAKAAMPSGPPRAVHICPCMLPLPGVGAGFGVKAGVARGYRVGSGMGVLLSPLRLCSSCCAVSLDTTCRMVLSAMVANTCASLLMSAPLRTHHMQSAHVHIYGNMCTTD